jgi:hypothetical protein
MTNDMMTQTLGFTPSRELRLQIMEYARNKGISIPEATKQFSLPDIVVPDENDMISTEEGDMTLDEYEKKYPFRKLIIIT